MGLLERNTFANLVGTFWSITLGVVCAPLFIKLMGVEAYGLVGVFVTLQSIFVVLDAGIGATLNREIARLSAADGDAQKHRDLVYTLQLIYWFSALLAGALIFALAPVVARRWVNPQALSPETVSACVRMMGVAVAVQFPFNFYQSGLVGLQRQVLLNGFTVALSALRWLGTLLALWLISPAPEVFFAGQIATSAVGTAAAGLLLWRCLPEMDGGRPHFRADLLRKLRRFSASYAANSLANLGLLQGDKIILSALLPLRMFGYYTLAQTVSKSLYAIIISLNCAIFPQFSGLVALGREADLSRMYHRACQLMSVTLMPLAVMLAVFSREVLMLWTGDPDIVENTRLILELLASGMMLYGVFQVPFFLQVAHDWWRLLLRTNLLLLLVVVPLNVVMARSFGGAGAAAVWVLLNVCYIATVPLMHRRLLRGEQGRWFFEDVCLPLGGALLAGLVAHWLMPKQLSRFETFVYLCSAGLLVAAAAASLASQVRISVLARVRRGAESFGA